MSELYAQLQSPLPPTVPAGRGIALFLFGACFHPTRRVKALEILVDGAAHPVTVRAMPRFDLFRALHPTLGTGKESLPEVDPDSGEDPEIRCYRSGFWATVSATATGDPGDLLALALRARLDDGGEAVVEIGAIEIVAAGEVAQLAGEAELNDGLIAVCMSTFNPDMKLFRRQIESLRGQIETNWTCVISDDCSRPERYREIQAVIEGDDRFVLSRSERRLGFYRGFERAVSLAPPDATLIALCDQDDRWYPDKLKALRAAIGGAKLVYSDQRLVDPDGAILGDTYWRERSNNHTSILSLLVANTITGAASLIRRDVVERSLPFPEVPGEQYHDHWLGLVAMSMGRVAYVDRALYDYVQHGGAALGHEAANAGVLGGVPMSLRQHLRLDGVRRLLGEGRQAYFFGYARLAVLAQTLLVRAGEELTRPKRRALKRFLRAERTPALGVPWLGLRSLRRRLGRNETLGAEVLLAQGILWRHALAMRARGVERPEGWIYDASLPPSAGSAVLAHGETETAHIQRIITPLDLSVSERAPERVNVLIPTIDLKHLFGGYIAKFNLARRLAESGYRVRIVTVDPTPPLPSDWRRQVESFNGLSGALDRVEVAFARDGHGSLVVSPRDRFIATTWWTAHIARAAVEDSERDRFLYLIQEYEPYTFEMGSLAALAMQTYAFPHVALFSTELLRKYFDVHRHGVFAAGHESGLAASVSFQNAITPTAAPSVAELASRESRRLLFYARSEQHARRNMFELGLIALSEAIAGGVFSPQWEFFGVGSVGGRSRVSLPGGAELEILPRLGQSAYGEMLGRHDVGLSLMLTPHPSLVPLEMASAGLLTVTNTFETKEARDLEAISANIIAAEPTIDGIVAGLEEAGSRVGRVEDRVAGASVAWSNDWGDTFDEPVMTAIGQLLEMC